MVGSIVFATEQGLGVLAKQFYDHGIIDVVSVHPHTTRTNHYEWYPNRVEKEQLLGCDTLLFFETPFDWEFVRRAKAEGIKLILMPMYECTPDPLPVEFDVILAPSDIEHELFKGSIRINVPVSVRYKPRKRARVFVHNSGNGGLGGRNGTREVIEAMNYVESPAQVLIRSQEGTYKSTDKRVAFEGHVPWEKLYSKGDVFIFPEKFNGLSLPLQEAFASGMLVMAGDRHPMNKWLPRQPLIRPSGYRKNKITREFDAAVYDPKEIARMIDLWYNRDITEYSRLGQEWALANSWEVLGPKYKQICEA